MKTTVYAALFVFCFMGTAAGQPAQTAGTAAKHSEDSGDSYNKNVIGLGMAAMPQYRGGSGTDVYVLPWFRLAWQNFFLEGNRGGYYFINQKKLRFGLAARPRRGWKDQDAVVLRGLGDRDWSMDGGLRLRWKPLRWLGTDTFVMTDLGGVSSGHTAEFLLVGAGKFGNFRMRPTIGYKWESENIVHHYYGVNAYQALPGRPVYRGDDAWSFTTAFIGLYELTENIALFGQVHYERLGDSIARSPLVEKRDQVAVMFGIGYQF